MNRSVIGSFHGVLFGVVAGFPLGIVERATYWGVTLRVRYFPTKESIYGFTDEAGALRADHTLAFAGLRFLTLRYEISSRGWRPEQVAPE